MRKIRKVPYTKVLWIQQFFDKEKKELRAKENKEKKRTQGLSSFGAIVAYVLIEFTHLHHSFVDLESLNLIML